MLVSWKLCRAAVIAATLCLPVLAADGASAQDWPTRPVRLILPFGPASATDLSARLISDELSARWRQPVIVDNRPGGDNLIAINAFLSANDDHTLLFTSSAAFLAHPYVHKKLDYVFERDFAPIAKVADTILVVAVPEAIGVKTVSEFIEAARTKPDTINLAGATGLPEFAIDALIRKEKLKSVRVPYKDLGAAARDLSENRIQFLLTSYASVRPFVESGKVRVIAAGSRERSLTLKDVPSIPESGYPILAMETSVTIFGNQNMLQAVREKIARDVQDVLQVEKIRQRIELTGQVVGPAGPAELAAVLKRQMTYAASIAKELGLSDARR